MPKAIFEVIVGNVGTVYAGNNYMVAGNKFSAYVKRSKAGDDRVAGESVVLLHNGSIRQEYEGTISLPEES